SRVRIQLEPDLPAEFGGWDAAGAEKPAGNPHFGFYVVAFRTHGAYRRPRTTSVQREHSRPAPNRMLSPPFLESAIPKFRGFHHGLLAPVSMWLPLRPPS